MIDSRMKQLIREMPKGENHIHIEGSIPAETVMQLAQRKKIQLPYESAQELDNYFQTHVTDLATFLDCYRLINMLCTDAEDYYDVVLAIGKDAFEQKIIYRELMLDYPISANKNHEFDRVIEACHQARKKALQMYGVDMALIVSIDRTLPTEVCLEYVRGFEPHLDIIDALGMDYDEVGHPPGEHKASFDLAGEMGLYRTCHASEVGPEYVWDVLNIIHCDRVDHGACSVEDATLVEYLAKNEYLLTECPTSNVVTSLYATLADQPLKRLMESGVKCSLNSDDPAFFGNLVLEFERSADQMGLSEKDIIELNRNSFKYSIKGQKHLGTFERWLEDWQKGEAGI